MKSTYQEQKDKGNLPIALYVDKDKKEAWEAFAKAHGMNLKGLISISVDFFMQNSDKAHNTEVPNITTKELLEAKTMIELLSKKFDNMPGMVQKIIKDTNTSYEALVSISTKDRLERIFEASKQRVLMPDTLKAALPVDENELYDGLTELIKSGKIEKTNLGWRRKS